ncbi:hypothetical protein [Microbacterium xylanilyticum]
MATTILAGATIITPRLVEGYEASREGGTIVHKILGRTSPDITLRPAGTRTGTLTLLFTDETAANNAWAAVCANGVLQLVSDERTIGMTFVVPEGQQIGFALDDATRNHWHVTVPFQEITP